MVTTKYQMAEVAPAPDRSKCTLGVRRVFDCFLYNGELDTLCIRLHELSEEVYRFVIVESDTTFSGRPKAISFNPLDPRVAPFAARIRHLVVKDMPQTSDPWKREEWQRNAVVRGVPDAEATDLILMSDVDEVPRATKVRDMAHDPENHVFGFELAFYYFFVNYRNIEGPEAGMVCPVAAAKGLLEKITPNELRHAVRQRKVAVRIMVDGGWHFSYLTDEAGIRDKIAAFSHQEFNNEHFLSSIDVRRTVRRGEDLFKRPGFRWSLVEITELPAWVQSHRLALSRLFFSDPEEGLSADLSAGTEQPVRRAAVGKHAEGLIQEGRPGEALQVLTSALREKETSELWNDWACAAFNCGDTELAASGYRRALQLDPLHRQAKINLVALLLARGSNDEAVPLLRSVDRLTEDEKWSLRQLVTQKKPAHSAI